MMWVDQGMIFLEPHPDRTNNNTLTRYSCGMSCLQAGVVQDSLLLFEAVDGGLERACRGATPFDNQPTYFVITSAVDLASCQLLLGINLPFCHLKICTLGMEATSQYGCCSKAVPSKCRLSRS